ncbi:hypothetical protein [Paraburkholderia silvatlantica]|uniref:hypothetical protein n=1 Tax=Paraburkholderia silvatlantica TaxID=321895 RepID=UPI0037501249
MRQLLPVTTPLLISGGNREFSYDSRNPAEVASEALIFFTNSSTAPQNALTDVRLLPQKKQFCALQRNNRSTAEQTGLCTAPMHSTPQIEMAARRRPFG